MPYIGTHSYQHASASAYDPGLRLGALIGGRITDIVSIGGELTFDASNRDDVPSGTDYREWTFNLTFSPMVQIPAGPVEIVLGPKLGLFVIEMEQTQPGDSVESSVTGWLAGVNAGLFVPVSPTTSLGLLVSYGFMWADQVCTRASGLGEICGSVDSDAAKVLGLTGAALF